MKRVLFFIFLTICLSGFALAQPTDYVAYWNFNEGSGNTASDSSGNGRTATLFNATSWAGGQSGNAISLDGVDDFASVSHHSSLDFATSSFTFTGWTYFSGTSNTQYLIDKKGWNGALSRVSGWFCGLGGTSARVACTLIHGSNTFIQSANNVIQPNTWTHVAFVVDRNSNAQIYVNGVASGSSVSLSGMGSIANSLPLNFGYGNGWGYTPFNGRIDEFKLYNRALSASEISQLHSSSPPPPGVVCGNSVVESGETCDSNSQACVASGNSGTQSCNNLCNGWNACVCAISCGAWLTCVAGTQTRTCVTSACANNVETQSCSVTPPPSGGNVMGVNLGWLASWNSMFIFKDIFKQSRTWVSQDLAGGGAWANSYTIPSDSNGWPLQIPFDPDGAGPAQPQKVRTIMLDSLSGNYPSGTYTLILGGSGQVRLSGDISTQTFNAPGTYSVNVANPANAGIHLEILQSNVNDPIDQINFIMPGFFSTYQSEPFNPTFLSLLDDFGVVRYMVVMRTNENTQNAPITWQNRVTPSTYTQTSSLAIEHIVQISNVLNEDVWFNVPHMADENYIRQAARYFRDNLEPNLKVYVEHSNEVWNSLFPQNVYGANAGCALNYHVLMGAGSGTCSDGINDGGDRAVSAAGWHAKRSVEIFQIFEEEFGLQENRVVNVMGGFAASSWINQRALEAQSNPGINTNNYLARAEDLSITSYYGLPGSTTVTAIESMTVDQILDSAQTALSGSTRQFIIQNKHLADNFGISLSVYEGNHHIIPPSGSENNPTVIAKMFEAYRHPRMRQLTNQMFDQWFELNPTGVFMYFVLINKHSGTGGWGALEYQYQDPSTSSLYLGLQDALAVYGSSGGSSGIVCGNNIVETGEQCGEPGLSCGTGETCSNCICASAGSPPTISSPYSNNHQFGESFTRDLHFTTHINANCAYSTSNVAYAQMTAFTNTGGTTHTSPIQVVPGGTYTYYVHCQNPVNGQTTPTPFILTFTVAPLQFTHSIFTGSQTTNFNSVSQPWNSGSVNLQLERPNHGAVFWTTPLSFMRSVNFGDYVIAEKQSTRHLVNVDSSGLYEVSNIPARIYFYDSSYTNPVVKRDGLDCGNYCSSLMDLGSGIYRVDVTGFSSYTLEEDSQTGTGGSSGSGAGGGGGGGSGGSSSDGSSGGRISTTPLENLGSDCLAGESQACGQENVGMCQQGVRVCEQGLWSACLNSVSSSEEICDGLDNDCDGDVDETCQETEAEEETNNYLFLVLVVVGLILVIFVIKSIFTKRGESKELNEIMNRKRV